MRASPSGLPARHLSALTLIIPRMATLDAERVYVEDWDPAYGTPYLLDETDDGAEPAEFAEPVEPFHRAPTGTPLRSLAFVDGVRRGEGVLHIRARDGTFARGVAGAHASGAVVYRPDQPSVFDRLTVTRMLITGSGEHVSLPPTGGCAWRATSIDSSEPDAPLTHLQGLMRAGEAQIAAELSADGVFTILDGPLNLVSSMDVEIAGFVKTHLRARLSAALHARVPDLPVAHRTPLFLVSHGRTRRCYSAYVRIAAPGPMSSPWAGIIRIELPENRGLTAAATRADEISLTLPRFAGIPHKDPRAPQNLIPIGALERRLRHLLGDRRLASRALRIAARENALAGAPATTPLLGSSSTGKTVHGNRAVAETIRSAGHA